MHDLAVEPVGIHGVAASFDICQWRHATLHQVLVHMVTERAHFLGRADILRELVDGTAGHRAGDPILTARSPAPGRVGTYRASMAEGARVGAGILYCHHDVVLWTRSYCTECSGEAGGCR
ncbi:mycothiol transferase [Pseudarthrobacter oxydans]|uniref:mycothiol transferase n=1 Tax=Pseudarthrobacter oxydans TaxID=1671 RepID=UPI002938250C|nr:DUF664 domain-containing protein [Actinomycetes bacterium ARC8]